jgi:enoyl-CoA hydratase
MSDVVTVEHHEDGIGVVTLNRPDRLNAITPQLVEDLHDALHGLSRSSACRAVILTGAGRAFCAGFDLKSEMADDAAGRPPPVEVSYRSQQRWGAMVSAVRSVPVPVIAAVNGPAAGGGFALALAADLRVASTTATFIVANVKIGLSGGEMGISYLLPRLVGPGRAAELMYTGRTVDATEAHGWGLVNRLVEGDQLLANALDLAHQIMANSPFAIRLTKEMLQVGVDSPSLEATLVLENRTQILAGSSGDIAEAITAFRERRPPRF